MIPPANPKANYLAHKADIDAAIQRVPDGGQYILGEEVAGFECEFATYIGVAYTVGVATQVHYPVPVRRQPAYRRLRADCPVTKQTSGEIVSLPMHARLTPREVQQVCELIVAHHG